MRARMAAMTRLARTAVRRWPIVLLFGAALVIVSYQYCTTLYHKEDAERGGGRYKPYIAVQDGHMIYLQAMSLVFDRDLDITDETDEWGRAGYRWETDDGRPIYPNAIGPVIAWAPMLALAHGGSQIANALGSDIAPHGYTLWHQRFTLYSSVIFVLLTAFFGYRSSRRLLGDTWAPPLAAIAILLGSNLSFYATERPDYGHALSAFVCAAFLAYWIKTVGQHRWQRFAWLGLLLGVAGLGRTANLFLGAVVAIEITWAGVQPPPPGEPRWRWAAGLVARGLLALAVAFVTMIPQFLSWKYNQESGWLTSPHGTDYVHLGRPMLAEFLWSGHNGFLSTHPLSYAGWLGLLMLPRRWRMVGVALFVVVLIQAYVNSCVYDWWGMGSYGARRMCCVAMALVVGLAGAMRASAIVLSKLRVPVWPRRVLGVLVLAWFVLWNQSYAEKARDRRRPEPVDMCCTEAKDFMNEIAEPVYEEVGNPFTMPASLLFAWRYDVDIDQWEKAVTGVYAARPSWPEMMEERIPRRYYGWNIPGVNFWPWLGPGMGPRHAYKDPANPKRRRFYRWTTKRQSSILLPLFLRGSYRLHFRMHGNLDRDDPPLPIRLLVNGTVIDERRLPFGWQEFQAFLPPGIVRPGTNVVTFESILRPARVPGLRPHPRGKPVGIAVSMMKLQIGDVKR